MQSVSVLFVCMGNICRSPSAEAVFRAQVQKAGLAHKIQIASAGTHAYHVGHPPDLRAQAAARARGFDMSAQRAQEITAELLRADYLLVMDEENRREVQRRFPEADVQKVMVFAPKNLRERWGDDIPDPYFGAEDGFEQVLDMLNAVSTGLLADIKARFA